MIAFFSEDIVFPKSRGVAFEFNDDDFSFLKKIIEGAGRPNILIVPKSFFEKIKKDNP